MKVEFRRSFLKDVKALRDEPLKERIKAAIAQVESAASLQEIHNIKKLTGGSDLYRIRIGDYRLGLVCEEGRITFVRCLHRREIYRYLP